MKSSSELELNSISLKCEELTKSIYKLYALYLQLIRQELPALINKDVYKIISKNLERTGDIPSDKDISLIKNNLSKIFGEHIYFFTVEHLLDISVSRKSDPIQDKLIKDKVLEIEDNNYLYDNYLNPNDKTNEINHSISNLDLDAISVKFFDAKLVGHTEELIKDISNVINENYSGINFDSIEKSFNYSDSLITNSSEDLGINQAVLNMNNDIEKEYSNKYIPTNPTGIIDWIENLDISLNRILANLSHLVNLELLNEGYISYLVPINVIESLADTNLINENTISSLIEINIPVKKEEKDYVNDLRLICLYIRYTDIEFYNSKIRNCRLKINSYIDFLYKLEKKQSYWNKKVNQLKLYDRWNNNI
tara:strand:- start:21579 stop:22673 length:1095 start_codon:yes stop_codon:yes gene_type:complete